MMQEQRPTPAEVVTKAATDLGLMETPTSPVVVVLAISAIEARPMVEAIRKTRGEGKVIVTVATGPNEIPSAVSEFVMTEGFQSQRSVRMLLTAIQAANHG